MILPSAFSSPLPTSIVLLRLGLASRAHKTDHDHVPFFIVRSWAEELEQTCPKEEERGPEVRGTRKEEIPDSGGGEHPENRVGPSVELI